MASLGTWTQVGESALTKDTLNALLRNEIAAIRIPNFATLAECTGFAKAVEDTDYKFYSVAKKVGYIGLAQIEYRWNRPKADYFKDAATAHEQLEDLQQRSFDVIGRLIATLQAVADGTVKVAEEADLGRYYAGIARIAAEGVDLHADWAPLNSPTYDIARIDGQLGWNFYAQELIEGGDTTVYNAPWNPACAPGEIPKSYGLDYAIVDGAKTFTFRPSMADVVIFNTRNPHEIAAGVAGPGRNRISIGSFIGRMPNNDLVLWS